MKTIRFFIGLVLVLGLVMGMPLAIQAQEKEFREVYLDAAYKISETQIVFDFSEPIKINKKAPYVDVRLTDAGGSIIGIYDKAGNRTGNYQWPSTIQYLNSEHDKVVITINVDRHGCDTISDMLGSHGTLPDDVKEKIDKGTYRFLVGMEEKYLVSDKENLEDGMLKNLCAEADEDVFVWPTRLKSGECVHWWLDELQPKPAGLVVDKSQFEGMNDVDQFWKFSIMSQGDPNDKPITGEPEVLTKTVVKNDPMIVGIILGVDVLVAAILVIVVVLITKKRKAA